jgi:antagonist of KipI
VLSIGAAPVPAVDVPRAAAWWIDDAPDALPDDMIRVLPGADATNPTHALFEASWKVANASDRQGLRLEGPALAAMEKSERISAPVAPGTIQLPPDGHPIVLLGDAQTHGGYPRIGHVARVDLPRLAQLRPGDTVRFTLTTPTQAQVAWRTRRHALARLALMIERQLGRSPL